MLEDRQSLSLVLYAVLLTSRRCRRNHMAFGLTSTIQRASRALGTRLPELQSHAVIAVFYFAMVRNTEDEILEQVFVSSVQIVDPIA